MDNVIVAHSGHSNQSVAGWGASLVFHACLALVALGLLPKMTVMVEKEPFKWDVALVEPPREVARLEGPTPAPRVQPPTPTPVKPRSQPVRAVEPPPQPVQRQVETRVLPQAVQREVQPVVETVRPQEQIQSKQEVVQMQAKPVEPQEVHKTEPVVQAVAPAEMQREVAAVVEQQVMEAAPATAQTYQAQQVVSAPAVVETVPEPVMTASAPVVHTPPAVEAVPATAAPVDPAPAAESVAAAVSEPVAEPPAPVEAVVVPTAPVAAVTEPDPSTLREHQVVAQAAVARPAPKADYGWLADSLKRRVIELRHYPSTARLNGWEGKVVLKVSISNDGQLKSVEVVKSSGHESLDQAAMEAVRRACPLHMKHELTAPMVVLNLPLVYSLNR
ncbi:MAG: TonB family protein [Nitrospira sp.]|nr:TonB family protein [Nitrospira sp.]HMV56122.1 TonB family protein [Nitrospira sp.]HMW85121.1 TonB family protein [Nitrospira sp.]HMZ97758.1 TonB family protein [Nitrospira sp.]HNA46660.1 TonB family protein [Nitrospira sp.]